MKKFIVLDDDTIINAESIAYLQTTFNHNSDKYASNRHELLLVLANGAKFLLSTLLGITEIAQLREVLNYIYHWLQLDEYRELKLNRKFYKEILLKEKELK